MSLALVARREAVIRSYLFLLSPNNSGSTYLSRAIGTSRHVWSLPHEGQHMLGYGGPSTLQSPWPLIWGGAPESLGHFADADYDWARTRKSWLFHASSQRDNAPVFFTKSPPFLLFPDQLARNFAPAKFLIMVRDPYATLEGILRRRRRSPDLDDPADLATIAARHLVSCFRKQAENREALGRDAIFFTYEELCADPVGIAEQIAALVPALDDLDLSQRLSVKGIYDEPLRNMNAEQIARLGDSDIAAANAVFAGHRDVIGAFGYQLQG